MSQALQEEFIRINKWVTEHAQMSYDNGYFIEALQVMHGWIENKLQELIILTGSIDHNSEMSKIWDIANQINLHSSAKILYILSQLSENEYQMIVKFNVARNEVIHKIYLEPYDKIYQGIPKERYDEVFNIGMKLCELLQAKTERKIEK